jgi:uncharacterized protein
MPKTRPLHFLIKPSSSLCNMRCRYCFYADVSDHREVKSYGLMSLETAENLIRLAFSENPLSLHFAFQGGEPSLRGLDFYRDFVDLVDRYNTSDTPVEFSMQTNGFVIDEEWTEFFKAHNFLMGLSLDGTVRTHNVNRLGPENEGTFRRVWEVAEMFQKAGVEFNILTVVNRQVAQAIDKIYPFYMKKGLYYQQYIPCLDPFEEERGLHDYSLRPEDYENFLVRLFDMWYEDVMAGRFVYIRFFENLVGMLLGYPPEACGMVGLCQPQLVIEADGGVYPCDFYVLDDLRIGNINQNTLAEIEENRAKTNFIEQSVAVDPACRDCAYFPLCRGGCRRDREPRQGDRMSLNYYCPAFKTFYAHALPKLQNVVAKISDRNRPVNG